MRYMRVFVKTTSGEVIVGRKQKQDFDEQFYSTLRNFSNLATFIVVTPQNEVVFLNPEHIEFIKIKKYRWPFGF